MRLFEGLVALALLFLLSQLFQKRREGFTDRLYKPNDPVFDDSKFFQYSSEADEPTGFARCLRECNGPCVEYGLTGSAWCHPCLRCQREKEVIRSDRSTVAIGESEEAAQNASFFDAIFG